MKKKSMRERAIEALEQFPEGLSVPQLKDLFPTAKNPNIWASTISALYNTGHVKPVGTEGVGKATARTWALTGKPINVDKTPTPYRNITLTDAGLQARFNDAINRITELETWQENAIARFPDLAVAQSVIEARKRVAEYYRKSDTAQADRFVKGLLDQSPMMQLVIKTIEDLGQ